ncbi:MAG: CYTH domain-containing protein, partial [Candidatus Micrarchaeota archaeon]|nr:CYTH domain-containing protein [Candidatus Micrarchaeota archaeon]
AWSPSFIIGYMGNVLERMYSTYVAPTRQLADMVITNDYDPRRETLRSDSREVQLKFRLDRAFRLPDNIAELASQASQRDEYYTPESMDLRKSDEIIRIRHEGGRKIFSYKGPRLGSGLIERANVTFPIDDSAEAGILLLYGRRISTVTKERLFYRTTGGVDICIDRNVAKLREGEVIELGDFLNARASPADSGPLRSLIDQLGLERSSMVADSYYNM